MDCRSEEEAIDRINTLGRSAHPFLFAVDYAKRHAYVSPLEEIDPNEVLYAFPSWSNTPPPPPKRAFEWTVRPESEETYRRKFEIVNANLRRGNSFLVNLTARVPVETDLSLRDIHLAARAPYRLWMRDRFSCFSPEPFIRIREGRVSGFPMKGTIRADIPDAESLLLEDGKETAEHATVTDLIRNDLSIIATHVRVKRYRYVERIRTCRGEILQTSSEITGRLPPDYRKNLGHLLFSQLPAGSITGAPKPKTIEIIRDAEDYDRGFYTGVMGICHDGNLDSAVMIRMVCQEDGKLYFKAGGGITARSRWENEYDELIRKTYAPIH